MAGGVGNDTYYIDNFSDVAQENPLDGLKGGDDTIVASLKSYALGKLSYIENLVGSDGGFTGTGNALDNKITGGKGDDVLDGQAGRDTLMGLGGNDTYIVDNELDFVAEFTTPDDGLTLVATGGIDTVKTTLSKYELGDFVEHLIFTGSGSFTGIGNNLANQITGGSGANTLDGGANNDQLRGGAGDDKLYGEDGNDILVGGNGKDSLYGGAGSDIFVFDTALNASTNKDAIIDFKVPGDSIHVSNSVFTKVGSDGALKAGAFYANNTGLAHDADDRIIYDKDSGVLYYDADGSGKGAGVAFANISKNLTLAYKDFYVI
jgi:Ca2+-binding RTX toxin-like protein